MKHKKFLLTRLLPALLCLLTLFFGLAGNVLADNAETETEESSEELHTDLVPDLDYDADKSVLGRGDIEPGIVTYGHFESPEGRLMSTIGEPVVITPGTEVSYGAWETNIFSVVTGHGSYTGVCAQPSKGTPSGTFTIYRLDNDVIKTILLTLPGAELEALGNNLYVDDWTAMQRFGYAHAVIGYIYSGDATGLNSDEISGINNIIRSIQSNVLTNSYYMSVINKYTCYVAYTGDTYQDIVWAEKENPGSLQVCKTSANDMVSGDNRAYTLAGAQYAVFKEDTDGPVCMLTTDENGYTETVELEAGIYEVCEVTASTGYRKDPETHQVVIESGVPYVCSSVEEPAFALLELVLKKEDAETGEVQGKAVLEGAEYRFCYYDSYVSTTDELTDAIPEHVWIFRTDNEGRICFDGDHYVGGDELLTDENGSIWCPLGTIVIQESKPSEGYTLNSEFYLVSLTVDQDGQVQVNGLPDGNESCAYEQVIRADAELFKRDADTGEMMSDVLFKITSLTTGESIEIATDADGHASTAGMALGDIIPSEGVGALPYDNYLLEELPCPANQGKQLVSMEFTVSEADISIDLGTIDNETIRIMTKAADGKTGSSEILPMADAVVTDHISYENLTPGGSYRLEGVLMDADQKTELCINGSPVVASAEFTAEAESGEAVVTFCFDASAMAGKKLVIFETLYEEGEQDDLWVAEHKDYNSTDQTIKVQRPALKASSVNTSDPGGRQVPLLIALSCAAFAAILILFYNRSHRRPKSKA